MSTANLRFSRRGFFGATAAALSAPMIIPRHVLGDEKNLPANEKIALGLIGIGKMMYGDHLPHYLKMKEVKVVAVCDVDTTRRTAGKKRVDSAYGSTKSLRSATPTITKSWPAATLMPSLVRRPTTGMPSSFSTRARPARTCIARSRWPTT